MSPDAVRIRETVGYILLVLITFALLQALVVVMHEFTHSTVAWLLGDISRPSAIVWGNPLMMTGWDEGVHYSKLFPSGHHPAEAVIGGSPLLVHTVIVVLGISYLQRQRAIPRRWGVHLLYWFVIANFMELIAYILMRAFASGGDVGHLNRGLGLSPWIVFVAGTLLLMLGLFVLFKKILPLMYTLFARGNRLSEWAILFLTAFLLFLWGSGIRVVFYVYPDPQWMFGLLGFAAFGMVLVVCDPCRQGTSWRRPGFP